MLRKHKVTLAAIIPDAERRTLIRKALVETNSALFSLMACTANPDGGGTLAGAVAEVARQLCLVLRKRWDSRGGLPMPLKVRFGRGSGAAQAVGQPGAGGGGSPYCTT